MFKIADIYETKVCPLARVMRREMKAGGIKDLKVVYSEEPPAAGHGVPGSISFVPSAAGLIIAGEVIRDIIY
jgi:tRNA A37 threonylcarbamoyladenosine dehydratase